MNLLSVERLSKSYGEKHLFSDISFGIEQGQRIALVARNGAGKSTLLNILSGNEIADSGNVVFRNDIRVSFLSQEPRFVPGDTVYGALFRSDNKIHQAVRDYEIILEKHAMDPSPANQHELETAFSRMDAMNAWTYESKVKQILSTLNIHQLEQTIDTLSGGEQKRIALARVLIEEPQMLIMDEPTNHLDLDMIEWLESYFIRNAISLLVVTHDRYFLDNVCTDILEMDNGVLFHYQGNFEYFIRKKAEREFNEAREFDKTRNLYRRELEWVRKMPRARTTKSKSRIDSFDKLQEKVSGKRQEEKLSLNVKMSRLGGKILELKKVYKSYGDKVILKGFDYSFKKGERIGIVGKNGVGKTSFLNIITGDEQADSGKVNTGDTIIYGHYSQKGLHLKEDKRVIEVVKEIADDIPLGDGTRLSASQFLQLFMFPPAMQYTFVSKLSGGEKKRLYLLTVLIKNPNFLILDEPTNDLDIITLSTLEQFLSDFKGCLIVISHDRYFMDKLVDHLFIFEGDGRIKDFIGNYSEYREEQKLEKKAAAGPKDPELPGSNGSHEKKSPGAGNRGKIKFSYKEKFEFENLEKEIAALEKQKEDLTRQLDSAAYEHSELMRVSRELGQVSEMLDAKFLRWMELSEKQ